MTSMNVPEPVMSLAIMPKSREASAQFSRALNRFTREDPTFRVRSCLWQSRAAAVLSRIPLLSSRYMAVSLSAPLGSTLLPGDAPPL